VSAEPAPVRHLHAVDADCEGCAKLRRELEGALTDLEAAQEELKTKRRQLTERKNFETKQRRTHEQHEVVEKLFEYWQEQCGHPKAKLGPAREKALLKALELHTPREIAMAIRGAAVGAWVDEKGVKHDGLPLICRDEEKLENFIGRYEAWKARQA
jgi:hypothetical protein